MTLSLEWRESGLTQLFFCGLGAEVWSCTCLASKVTPSHDSLTNNTQLPRGHSLPAFLWISAAPLGSRLFTVPSDPLFFLQKTLACCIVSCLCLIRYLVCLWNFSIKTKFLPLTFPILGLCHCIWDCINCREGPHLAFCSVSFLILEDCS